MVLKVLHQYLHEYKVAFIATANKSFDAANANRMTYVYRSIPSKDDQKISRYDCLGLQNGQTITENLDKTISCLCQDYRRVLESPVIPKIFHDRDFINILRELRFELRTSLESEEIIIHGIRSKSLLCVLEDNFNKITSDEFEKLTEIFFKAIQEKNLDFELLQKNQQNNADRNIITILQDSMKLDSVRCHLYDRYKLIIDESNDESAIRLLFQMGIIASH
ncbi:unnamed protein product [Rotaria sordida]|uniref:Uncharacterized protein n=1 Tax=Rotaria sordida TaxID=392033 RepID=A0A819U1N0_9BILA|nr:unnamed protein product [Rotaria sordida]CAF4084327.1 unnamed protein product [Rotaria sordida]